MIVLARVEIWDRLNTTKLADLWVEDGNGFQRNFDDLKSAGEKLGESGSGSVTIQRDHPAAEFAVPGNVVRLCAKVDDEDPVPVWAWTISEHDDTLVTLKQKDETIVLEGPGLLERWAASVVAPWIEGRPISQDRVWNWAAPRGFDDSGWSTTSYVQSRSTIDLQWPTMYPVSPDGASMLWSSPSSITQAPGSLLFRVTVEPDHDCDVVAFHSADDTADAWVDGVLLNRQAIVYPDHSGWVKTWREVPSLSAGPHVFGYRAVNLAVGGAYFMGTIMETNGATVIGDPLTSTGDGTWKWFDAGNAPTPGFTAPQIVEMLLDEAQARGELEGWSVEAHGDFDNIPEFSCRVGASYREVLDALMAADLDVGVDVEGLVLHLWPPFERGDAHRFDFWEDDLDVLSVATTDDVVTAVLIVWSDGATWVERGDHPVLGRVSKSLSLGSVTDLNTVLRVGEAYLDSHAEPSRSVVASIENIDLVPGVQWGVGDWGGVMGEALRCVGLTWTVERDGRLTPVPEFGSISSLRRRTYQLTLDRLTSRFESPLSASVLTSKSLVMSGYPSSSDWTWSWSGSVDDLEELDDPEKPAQPKSPDTVRRLWLVTAEVSEGDLPDAWGDTTIRIVKNGATLNSLYDVTLTTTVAKVQKQIWAYETCSPSDQFTIQIIEFGGHVDGAVTISHCDAV